MGIIALEGLKFHGYHGVHENERENGNSFIIDVQLEVDFNKAANEDNIEHTIDYEEVYRIVKDQMEGSSYLLEHLGQKILSALNKRYTQLLNAQVKVSKLNPPIGGHCDKATVVVSSN